MSTEKELRPITTVDDLNRHHKQILALVTFWHCERTMKINGVRRNIAWSYEPPIEELFDWIALKGMVSWSEEFRRAHEELLSNNILTKGSICGRNCDWLLSEQARRFVNELFANKGGIYPPWSQVDGKGPLNACDFNELSHHRKAVAVARYHLNQLGRVKRMNMYPGKKDGLKPDIAFEDRLLDVGWGVEAFVLNNDRNRWLEKWQSFASVDHPIIWIFENRTAMVQFLNHVHRNTDDSQLGLTLPSGAITSEPNNWAAKTMNKKLQKARVSPRYCNNGATVVFTLTGLFRKERGDVDDWIEDGYNNEF